MMNNPWFKVRPHLTTIYNASTKSYDISLKFEHPTIPTGDEGWMKKGGVGWELPPDDTYEDSETEEESKTASTKQKIPSVDSNISAEDEKLSKLPMYNLQHVESHSTETDCWIVVRGLVYDCTPFLRRRIC
jgi:hypothetical protein